MHDYLLKFREAIEYTNNFLELNLKKFEFIQQKENGLIILSDNLEDAHFGKGFFLDYDLVKYSESIGYSFQNDTIFSISVFNKIYVAENGYLVCQIATKDHIKNVTSEKLKGCIAIANKTIETYRKKFKYITQIEDGSIILHDELNLSTVRFYIVKNLARFANSIRPGKSKFRNISLLERDSDFRYYLSEDGTLSWELEEASKPPQKHIEMINEWIDSGGKLVVQQCYKISNGRKVWIDDRCPNWLGAEYRFKPTEAEEPSIVELDFTFYSIEGKHGTFVSVWPVYKKDQEFVELMLKDKIEETSWHKKQRYLNEHSFCNLVISGILRQKVSRKTFWQMVNSDFYVANVDYMHMIENALAKYSA